jgi:hypothetical protein
VVGTTIGHLAVSQRKVPTPNVRPIDHSFHHPNCQLGGMITPFLSNLGDVFVHIGYCDL